MSTRNISLTERLDRFVETNVSTGRYQNASEVVRMPCDCCSSVIRRTC